MPALGYDQLGKGLAAPRVVEARGPRHRQGRGPQPGPALHRGHVLQEMRVDRQRQAGDVARPLPRYIGVRRRRQLRLRAGRMVGERRVGAGRQGRLGHSGRGGEERTYERRDPGEQRDPGHGFPPIGHETTELRRMQCGSPTVVDAAPRLGRRGPSIPSGRRGRCASRAWRRAVVHLGDFDTVWSWRAGWAPRSSGSDISTATAVPGDLAARS